MLLFLWTSIRTFFLLNLISHKLLCVSLVHLAKIPFDTILALDLFFQLHLRVTFLPSKLSLTLAIILSSHASITPLKKDSVYIVLGCIDHHHCGSTPRECERPALMLTTTHKSFIGGTTPITQLKNKNKSHTVLVRTFTFSLVYQWICDKRHNDFRDIHKQNKQNKTKVCPLYI